MTLPLPASSSRPSRRPRSTTAIRTRPGASDDAPSSPVSSPSRAGARSLRAGRERRTGRPWAAHVHGLAGRPWQLALLRNVLLWLLPAAALWALLTPAYNRFLLEAAGNLLHLVERPDVTALYPHPASHHDAYIARLDFPPVRRLVRALRVTDVHFHLVLTAALFLAVPRVPWRERLGNLAWALVATAFFDILVLVFEVKATYATRLGAWSLEHHGPWSRNLYGLAAHLLGLPFKLALPFALWAGFHLPLLLAERDDA